jgi:hypothetical protein
MMIEFYKYNTVKPDEREGWGAHTSLSEVFCPVNAPPGPAPTPPGPVPALMIQSLSPGTVPAGPSPCPSGPVPAPRSRSLAPGPVPAPPGPSPCPPGLGPVCSFSLSYSPAHHIYKCAHIYQKICVHMSPTYRYCISKCWICQYPMLYIEYSGIWIFSIILRILIKMHYTYYTYYTALHSKSYF